MEKIEIRCPIGPRRLFFKVRAEGMVPEVTSDNLLEIACADCRRLLRKRGVQVDRVIHCYNIAGELVESYIENDSSDSR